jgi:hypothetical protein
MMKQNKLELAKQCLSDAKWRINNLYYIVDKSGRKIKFELNWAQEELYHSMWYCNVILKARQLGISTFVCLLFLDRCLFNSNQSAGIIAHTVEDAQAIFRRVKFAYDSLPEHLRAIIQAENDTANMLKFSNGSSLRVGTSLRSSTFQYLHISEFGKICAKYPDKAQEIITGSLNTVAPGQYIFIESTAEGKDGYFYDICKRAQKTRDSDLSKIDFKFHFYPWHKEPAYRIGSSVRIDDDILAYFDHLEKMGIKLDYEQKSWYASKANVQQDEVKREYPSTADEAWEVSNEGLYYGKQMAITRVEGRISRIPYEEALPVHTAWDLGYNDSTAIWLFQIVAKEIRLIEYIEGSGESLAQWLNVLKSKDYTYGKHLAPHDITVKEYSNGMSRQSTARNLGFNLLAVPKLEVVSGIDAVRNILNRCCFDEKKCAQGVKVLENYKKEWDEKHVCWRSQPLHNWASHGADAFRTLATGLHFIVQANSDDGKRLGGGDWNNRFGQKNF